MIKFCQSTLTAMYLNETGNNKRLIGKWRIAWTGQSSKFAFLVHKDGLTITQVKHTDSQAPPRWSNGWRACLVCGKSRVRIPKGGQILHSIASCSPPLQHLRRSLCCLGAMRWAVGYRKLITRFGVIRRV